MNEPGIPALAGTETEKNLRAALSAEGQVRLRYECGAACARTEGYRAVADTFARIAENERAHGEIWLRLLDGAPDTATRLRAACQGEHAEWSGMYAGFAQKAREEGFAEIAALFERVASVERTHEEDFGRWLASWEAGAIFRGDSSTAWKCLNCGFVFVGAEPPSSCPACSQPRDFFLRA